jgi:hypothetical protein
MSSNSTAVVQQYSCGAAVQLWCSSTAAVQQFSCGAAVQLRCNSLAVVQQFSCQCVKLQNVSFSLLIKINRCSKGAVVSVHVMKAYGGVAG